jgi:formamidopyrimidine-DNA glycosylase
MPELPEVETIKRGLERLILHKKISRVEILNEKSWRGMDAERVLGQEIVEFDRRGKALLVRLSNNLWMMAHLRMTGQMIVVGAGEKFAAGHPDGNFTAEMPSRHTRIWFEFDDGSHLYFNDLRKFGFIKLTDELGLQEDDFLRKLAPEPWDMSSDEFWARLQKHPNSPIKAVLLNQHIIAGVGNIYADEACFVARIFPGVKVREISRETADELLHGLREVMQRSIDSGGSTMKDYVRADGTRGSYLEKFAQVFRRDGEACHKCGSEILKTRVAGRGTHYCPKCQPKGKVDA